MLAGGATGLVAVLSLYWITSTIIAMVIVTLPGMYPMKALRLAGDIAVGRRIRILLRLTWLVVLLLLAWAVVLIPTIVLDGALASAMPIMANVPIVPMAALLLASFSVVFSASYVYVLYRKVVEDDSAPPQLLGTLRRLLECQRIMLGRCHLRRPFDTIRRRTRRANDRSCAMGYIVPARQ